MKTTRTLPIDGITFEEAQHHEPFWMPRHTHQESHLILLFSGALESVAGKRESVVRPSQLLFVPAGETHTTRYHDSVHAFYIQLRSFWWERMQEPLKALQEAHEYQHCPPVQLARQLYTEFQTPDTLTPLMLEGLTIELLVSMVRHNRTSSEPTPPRWLQLVQEFVHAHWSEPLDMTTLASIGGVHPGHLMRAFRQHTGCSIGTYIRKLRVEQASQLICDPHGEHDLATIALLAGFADQSHFTKTFKQFTGMTPGELRTRGKPVTLVPKMRR
jgi:AraC family transcriptional regulator